MIGQSFGRWTVIERSTDPRWGQRTVWVCRCECGQVRDVYQSHLRGGQSKSCGCYRRAWAKANTTHGYTVERQIPSEYWIWVSMRQRCGNPANHAWESYGGRGIFVCKEWATFERFYADMGSRPSPRHSLDRIDNDREYSKANCRWATAKQQGNNRRFNTMYEHNGTQLTLTQLAELHGLTNSQLVCRLENGWFLEDALTTPLRRTRRYEHAGLSLTLPEWSARTGIPDYVLRLRLRRLRWPLARALSEPVGKQGLKREHRSKR